jgi:hypothetical protein
MINNVVNMINTLILPTVAPTNMPDLSMRSLFSQFKSISFD